MELKELNKRIKDKFGTISSFCRVSGEDPYHIQKLFSSERKKTDRTKDNSQEMARLGLLVKDCTPTKDKTKISPELKAKIGDAITARGGVLKFIAEYPQFSKITIYQILDGHRKRRTTLVDNVIKFLEIDE